LLTYPERIAMLDRPRIARLARLSSFRRWPWLVAALPALVVLAVPGSAGAVCTNGDPLDCNPPGATLNPAGRFVDPAPPLGAAQCAGFINTAADDVDWNWENNCIPYNTGDLLLRVYAMDGTVIAGAHLFNGVDCPWGVTDLGYDTDSFEGEGFLGHAGICDGGAGTTFGWHEMNTSFCSCGSPDGVGSRTCDDIFTANAANTAIFYVGGNSTAHAYEAVYGPPGGKNSCSLDAGDQHEVMVGIYIPNPDADGDGVLNFGDNCPEIPNPLQENLDGDMLGDVCDPCIDDPGNDVDADGVCALDDNCVDIANPMQENADVDALGDACDPCPGDAGNDPDADEICAAMDNCPEAYNPTQIDQDMDGIGAVCDACPLDADDDTDGDGLCADADNCPDAVNPGQEDTDMDDVGDACDACPQDDDRTADADADGLCLADDNCPDVANAGQEDADGDGQGDACDACPGDAEDDADGDGVCGDVDNCPADANEDQADEDGDGVGDACDVAGGSTGADDTAGTTGVDDTTGGGSESGVEPDSGSGPIDEDSTGGPIDVSTSGDTAGQLPTPGCGCTTDAPASGGAAWWLVVVTGLLRRRRRSAA
jgi:MYXO-CTERM domain-containing protein